LKKLITKKKKERKENKGGRAGAGRVAQVV
jgi:hypothetical protein